MHILSSNIGNIIRQSYVIKHPTSQNVDTIIKVSEPVTVKKNKKLDELDTVDKLSRSKKSSQRLKNNQSGKTSREESDRSGILGIELTMKVMPAQNQFVEAGEGIIQTGAKLVQVDEDYD